MRRLLIVGCSATKDQAAGDLPALERYRGAYFQMIKTATEPLPEIVILSAEFGFIRSDRPIPDYNRRMDKTRAAELLADLSAWDLSPVLSGKDYDQVFVAAGSLYRGLIGAALGRLWIFGSGFSIGLVNYARGGIGEQRGQLKAWLAGKG